VLVLEARDRVAGRTDHHVLANGDVVEMGGQWVGPTRTEILALIDELGLRTYPQYASGDGGAGVWTQYGPALAEPVGRIHWAGAETADVWNGYMDGAARSGRRAAAEVLAALGATTSLPAG
jgi:monoamine oxidase